MSKNEFGGISNTAFKKRRPKSLDLLYKGKHKNNNEFALKSACLKISVDKRRGRKILLESRKFWLDKPSQFRKSKNIRETSFRESLFSKISRDKLLRKSPKSTKFAKVCLAKVSTIKL